MLVMHFFLAASLLMASPTCCAALGLFFESLKAKKKLQCSMCRVFSCSLSLQPHSSSAMLAHDLTWWFDQLEKEEACPDTEGSALPPTHLQQSDTYPVIIKNKNKM